MGYYSKMVVICGEQGVSTIPLWLLYKKKSFFFSSFPPHLEQGEKLFFSGFDPCRIRIHYYNTEFVCLFAFFVCFVFFCINKKGGHIFPKQSTTTVPLQTNKVNIPKLVTHFK